MKRVVANIFEDTREALNYIKEEFSFKSDDEAIRYLCQTFLKSERACNLKEYLNLKENREVDSKDKTTQS